MLVYHFSEESDIGVFKPREAKSYPHMDPVVFAIDQEHSIHYMLPRDCPRVIYWKAECTTESDLDKFFGNTTIDKIIVVENGWLDRIRNTPLYRYTFPAETFELWEEAKTAGYYISYKEVIPLKVEPVGDMLANVLAGGVELRFTPNLHPIRNAVIESTVDFSIIRFRNARE